MVDKLQTATRAGADRVNASMEVPREAVGFIIGRHGETVRSLSTRSGALIVVDEHTTPPASGGGTGTGAAARAEAGTQAAADQPPGVFNITGTAAQIRRAQELISEKVNAILFHPPPPHSVTDALVVSPTTPTQGSSPPLALPKGAGPAAGASSGQGQSNGHMRLPASAGSGAAGALPPLEMWIPAHKVGMVIGQKGQVVGAIQDKSGATIVVHNHNQHADGSGSKLLTISGDEQHRKLARTLIERVLARQQRTAPAAAEPTAAARRSRAATPPAAAKGPFGAGPPPVRADRALPAKVAPYAFAPPLGDRPPHTQPFAQLVPAHRPPLVMSEPPRSAGADAPIAANPPPPAVQQARTLAPVAEADAHAHGAPRIQLPPQPQAVIAHPPPPPPPYFPVPSPYGNFPYPPPPRPAHGHAPAPGAPPPPQHLDYALTTTKPVCVPTSCVGIVIGKGGETIRDLQSRSGAYIKVTPDRDAAPDDSERAIYISGPLGAVELAHNLLNDIVNEGLRRSYRNGNDAGRNEGGGGAPSTAIAPESGGDGGGATEQKLTIDGEYRLVSQAPTQYPSTSISIELSIPNAKVGVIIGKGGQTIRELQQKSGARIVISKKMDTTKEDNPRLVTITGPAAFVEAAHALMQAKMRGEDEASPAAAGVVVSPRVRPDGGAPRAAYFAAPTEAEMHAYRTRMAAMHHLALQQQAMQAAYQQAQAAAAAAYPHHHMYMPPPPHPPPPPAHADELSAHMRGLHIWGQPQAQAQPFSPQLLHGQAAAPAQAQAPASAASAPAPPQTQLSDTDTHGGP